MSPGYRYWGIAFALAGTVSFAFRPILIKLAYGAAGAHPVSATTLLFLRMMLSLPFFLAMAWWLRDGRSPIARSDWLGIVGLGLLGYYLASLLDFLGLQYVPAGHRAPDHVPLPDPGDRPERDIPEEESEQRKELAALAITYARHRAGALEPHRYGRPRTRCSCSARC